MILTLCVLCLAKLHRSRRLAIIRSEADRIGTASAILTFETGTQATILISDVALSPWGFEAGIGENPHIGTTGQDMWWLLGTKGPVGFIFDKIKQITLVCTLHSQKISQQKLLHP